MSAFSLKAPFAPAGDQPQAIKKLVQGVNDGLDKQTLLGVTGSGKTFTMASVIAETNKPALVMSHNKTLAAQLAQEFRSFFPDNAVEYFVSYYDYYQPEAYIARSDTYIQKDAAINQEIDKLRHSAMESILLRNDVIVVASVSCIYGLGAPTEYLDARIELKVGQQIARPELLRQLTGIQYSRNDVDFSRGTFRVRGDVIDIHPAGEDDVVRVEFFGNEIEKLSQLDAITGREIDEPSVVNIFPATFFMTSPEQMKRALDDIRTELRDRIQVLKKIGKELEAARLAQRTSYDLEMIEQIGYVSGIENYSRVIEGRAPGSPPSTLLDYFNYRYGPDGFLTFIDESHMSVPQVGAMFGGDSARKKNLIEYGFRLPSAADNRPLKFHEFEDRIGKTIFVSATPAQYEANTSKQTVEQIIRPTGLLDPTIEIKPTKHQVDDVIDEIQERIKLKERVLVTTLTKRMAEELSTYLNELGLKAAYLHSDIDALERLDILRNLREGIYDVVIGINLLREGLDLPEVSLIAIMDADKEGYLRSDTALIQTMGRAARHEKGHVIMYADKITGSMQRAIDETDRRRKIQQDYNEKHGITPKSVKKDIYASIAPSRQAEPDTATAVHDAVLNENDIETLLKDLRNKMNLAAQNLQFEKAAQLRDAIRELKKKKREQEK